MAHASRTYGPKAGPEIHKEKWTTGTLSPTPRRPRCGTPQGCGALSQAGGALHLMLLSGWCIARSPASGVSARKGLCKGVAVQDRVVHSTRVDGYIVGQPTPVWSSMRPGPTQPAGPKTAEKYKKMKYQKCWKSDNLCPRGGPLDPGRSALRRGACGAAFSLFCVAAPAAPPSLRGRARAPMSASSVRHRTTPVDSGRLRSTPYDSGRLRATPYDSGRLRSTLYESGRLCATPRNSVRLRATLCTTRRPRASLCISRHSLDTSPCVCVRLHTSLHVSVRSPRNSARTRT
eukprot:gene22770-biopygen14815